MTTKQLLFSAFILGVITANAADESNSSKPRTFKLNSKTFFEDLPIPGNASVMKNTGEGECFFKLLDADEIKKEIAANNDTPCVYCPRLNTMILNSSNITDCKNAQIGILSTLARNLEKENAELKERLASIQKILK